MVYLKLQLNDPFQQKFVANWRQSAVSLYHSHTELDGTKAVGRPELARALSRRGQLAMVRKGSTIHFLHRAQGEDRFEHLSDALIFHPNAKVNLITIGISPTTDAAKTNVLLKRLEIID